MDKWEKQVAENLDLNKCCEHFYHYKRKMGRGPAATKAYDANVFICTFSNVDQLICNWKEINYIIAFHVQSKNEELIEKSNYYICLFINKQIDSEQKNIIQGNSFCAKKYIFEDDTTEETECLKKVEQKIFALSFEENVKTTPKIKQIELQNFRGYEGNFKIDLTGKKSKPAAFTLIYAKNGYGKTSLFDGVEYAFKGEVSRIADLEKVNKKEPMKGPVYHNKNRADKKAYASLRLDNGKEIRRKVASIQAGKNDCRINHVGKNWGQDIVGLAEEKDKWNRIILPHDKIDSFISAHTPSAKYIEWTNSAPDLQGDQEIFIEAYRKLRRHQIKLEKTKEELRKQQKELQKLEQSKTAVTKLNELCEQYNILAKAEDKLFISVENSNVESYDSLLNKISRVIRNIENNILPQYESYVSSGKVIKDGDIKDSESLELSLNNVQSEKDKCINQKEKIRQYSEAKRRINDIQNEIGELQVERAPLDAICKFGLKKVEDGRSRYIALNKEIEATTETINYFDSEFQKIVEVQNDLIRKIDAIEKHIISEEMIKMIEKRIKVILNTENELMVKSQDLQNVKTEIAQINDKIEQNRLLLERVNAFVLPEELDKLCVADVIGAELIFSKEEQDSLKQFESRLREQQKELKIRGEILNQENVVIEEIREICKAGTDFLLAHRDQKICPLCKTPFANWEELFTNVSRVEEIKEEQHQQKMQMIIDSISQLDAEYMIFYSNYFFKKENKQTELLEEIIAWNKTKSNKEIQQEKQQMEVEQLCRAIKSNKDWIEGQKVILNNYSLEAWQQYINEKQVECQELSSQKVELEIKKIDLKELIANNKKIIGSKIKEKELIVNDSQLYTYILFLMNKQDSFDVEYERNTLTGHIFVLQNEKNEKEAILKQNEEYAQINLAVIEEQIIKCNAELERLYELKKKASIFKTFSPEGIEECLNLWEKEMENHENQLELLHQMSEENGARSYFEKYKAAQKAMAMTKKEIEEGLEKEQILRQEFEVQKDKLEKLLKSYFSQAVMNEIFQKIDPHDIMKNVTYHLDFSEKDEPQLFIKVCESDESAEEFYRPEFYFSTAQLNTVAFSSFFGRALAADDMAVKTICIDDPIGHFDDMNILGFTDMIRCILETQDCQIIMSTHDEKVFQIMERKLDEAYYNTSFIRLENSEKVEWNKEMGLEME